MIEARNLTKRYGDKLAVSDLSFTVKPPGIGFHLPRQELAAFVLLAVVAGIGAAVLPARRAARLNVLHALQYE